MDWRRSLTSDRRASLVTRGLLLLAVTVFPVFSAQAQQGFDVQTFNPMPSQFTNYFSVAQARTLESFQWELGLLYNYGDDPLVLNDAEGNRVEALVAGQHVINIMGAIGFGDFFDIGFDVPLIVAQDNDDSGRIPVPGDFSTASFGVGDLRLVPKFRFYTTDTEESPGGTAMGLLVDTYMPTGDPSAFQGENFRIEPTLTFDFVHDRGSRFSLNAGYLYRSGTDIQNTEVNDMVTYGMAADFLLAGGMFHIVPELFGGTVVGASNIDKEESPLEFLLGFKIYPIDIMLIEFGGGTGILEGVGVPDWRIFFGLAFSVVPEKDNDHDGILNSEDDCPDDPEDPDGFEDADGCPDPDNDQDTILDVYDQCPQEPEDIDTWQDDDGCPDPDNDGDRVLDNADICPLDAEDFDSFEDEDGCPDLDNDLDGIADDADRCPNNPEDFDEFEDEDGCPDLDNDQDTILDENDACPMEPEVWNGFEDTDGCPDEGIIMVTCEAIEIMEKVYFETDSDVIRSRSFELLDTIASVLHARPDILLVRVEGHTDDRGSDSYNLDLSQRRAGSVRTYLIEQGIDPGRLLPVGYGEQHFIATNRTRDGRAENRRVEFRILEQEGCPDAAPPPY